jgi:hypothetical protein
METIKKLLTDGVLTIEEVLDYVEQYQRAMDEFDDAQIDKYYQEEYGDNNIPDEYYGDWECSEGTLHSHDQECDCPNYTQECYPQEYIDEMNKRIDDEEINYVISSNPEYIIASTSRALEETLIYEANADGQIIAGDYGGISCRYNPELDWTDNDVAVERIFGKGVFEKISDIIPTENGYHVHYKRINIVNP